MAASDDPVTASPGKAGPSLVMMLVSLVIVTIVAAAAGAGPTLLAMRGEAQEEAAAKKADEHGAAPAKAPEKSNLRELPPIVTNLASPAEVWVRLEATLLIDAPPSPELEAAITETASDTLAFMRTVSLAQLQGASGLHHLRQDLSERASIRTKGKVREFVIHSLVVQ